jgi:DegV family protein with EDD domain
VTIHLVTDSTSDIEQERAAEHGITVVPLTVDFGGQTYRDGIDLDNKAFYAKLASSSVLPKTSTPSVEAFRAAYEKAIADGATAILSVHISGALSGTLNTATLAANQLTEERERAKKAAVPIRLIDSRSVSAGFGYPVLLAAERAKAGASLDDLAAFVLRISEGSKTLFLLDTLEYLQKGGRIGAAQAVIGTMLSACARAARRSRAWASWCAPSAPSNIWPSPLRMTARRRICSLSSSPSIPATWRCSSWARSSARMPVPTPPAFS